MYPKALRKPSLPATIAAALAAIGLAACAATIDQRGELPDKDRLVQIHPGTTTREEVAKILGTPSSTGVFDSKQWYYISRRTKHVAFFDPDVLDQQVYIIDFDNNGVVKDVAHKGLKDGRDIGMAPGATPAPGRELTFLEQVIGNIGRFDKGSSSTSQTTP